MNEQMLKNIRGTLTRASAFILAVLCAALTLAPSPAMAEETAVDPYAPPEVEAAPYIYLYNFENDTVLYEKGDPAAPVYPTSTVKIMAGITAIEALGEDGLSKTCSVTEEMLAYVIGNRVGFEVGEIVSAEQMLYCMLVNGANDAAIILAHIVAGSVDEFVAMMNKKAFEIGAVSTSYVNPTGMHSDAMVTTTADTVTIARYAYGIPLFMEIVSTPTYQMAATNFSSERKLYNRNCLISRYYRSEYFYDNAIGMNAGSTTQGGYASVTVARSGDGQLTHLCVIMGAEAVEPENGGVNKILTNYSGAIDMFNWAFRAFGYKDVLSPSNVVCEVPIGLSSTADYVTLVPSEKLSVFLPAGVDTKSDIRITSTAETDLKAPVSKGQKLGSAKVMYGEAEIGRVDLVSTTDVTRSEFLFALERISEFTGSRFFIATVVSAVVLTVIYVLIQARLRQKRLHSRLPRGYRGDYRK